MTNLGIHPVPPMPNKMLDMRYYDQTITKSRNQILSFDMIIKDIRYFEKFFKMFKKSQQLTLLPINPCKIKISFLPLFSVGHERSPICPRVRAKGEEPV